MKCSNCGAENPEGKKFCGDCGKDLARNVETTDRSTDRICVSCGRNISWDHNVCPYCGYDYETRTALGPTKQEKRICVSCGRSIAWDYNVCPYCGHDFEEGAPRTKKGYAVAGGASTITSALLSIFFFLLIAMEMRGPGQIVVLLMLILNIVAIIGGSCALAKKYFPMAVAGGICAIAGGFGVLGIPGLILIAISRRQFKRKR